MSQKEMIDLLLLNIPVEENVSISISQCLSLIENASFLKEQVFEWCLE